MSPMQYGTHYKLGLEKLALVWRHSSIFPVHSQLGIVPLRNKSNVMYVSSHFAKTKKVPSTKKQRVAKSQSETKCCSLLKFTENGHLYWKL